MTYGKAARFSYTMAANNKAKPRGKLDPRDTFNANDFYARSPNPLKKTNSKNRSNLDLGDPRAQTFDTTNMVHYRSRQLPNPRAPLVEGFAEMPRSERDKIYKKALERTTEAGVRKLEASIRTKIDQRTSGGAFALRKAFKCFDRDGSGDIDPDEFLMAMDRFGLQFTEDAVLGLFGLYDDDRGGSLGYYEFVDNILSGDKSETAVLQQVAQRIASTSVPPSPDEDGRSQTRSPALVNESTARKFFDECDNNGNGKIELTEVRTMFEKLGIQPDSDVLNKAFVVLDKNFDGEITFEEFWEWWRVAVATSSRRGGDGEQGRKTHQQREKERAAEEAMAEALEPPTRGDVLANSPVQQGKPHWKSASPNFEY